MNMSYERKMRILIISTVKYSYNGMTTVIKNLYMNEVFTREKVTFLVPASSNNELKKELMDFGFEVITDNLRNKNSIKYIKYLKGLIKKNCYDLIHIHGNSHTVILELLAAKMAGCPVRIVHAHNTACKHIILHRLLTPLFNKLYTHGFACSKNAGKFMFGEKDCKVINNAFNVSRYQFNTLFREKYRKEFNIKEDTVVIGHVGGFNSQKNQLFLIKVFELYYKINHNAVLLLIGDGNTRKNIEDEIAKLSLCDVVILAGNRSDVSAIINVMDYFVFPSLYEGLGIACIEAQANGLPILCASENIPSIIKINKNFKFMSLSDGEKKWAEELTKISKEREKEGFSNVLNAGYDLEREVQKLYEIYSKLV